MQYASHYRYTREQSIIDSNFNVMTVYGMEIENVAVNRREKFKTLQGINGAQ